MSYDGVKKRGYERIAIDVVAVIAKTFSAYCFTMPLFLLLLHRIGVTCQPGLFLHYFVMKSCKDDGINRRC